jgi:DNA-binding NarL/FixJ family response regulator
MGCMSDDAVDGPDEPTIRVAIVDDHELVREGLRAVLELVDDIEVVAEAGNVAGAVPMLVQRRPDVALIDIQLPDGSGVDICRAVRDQAPEVRCLVVTSVPHDETLLEAVSAGAAGYVLKQIRGGELVTSIRRVAAGETLVDPRSAGRVRERAADGEADPLIATLTPQERRLLTLVARGLTNRQIAGEMFLAEKTVKNYVTTMLSKLGMVRRSEAAAYAARAEERRRATGASPDGEAIRY